MEPMGLAAPTLQCLFNNQNALGLVALTIYEQVEEKMDTIKSLKQRLKTGFIASICVLVATFATSETSMAQQYRARLSYHWFPKHFAAITANRFVDEVEKATDHRLKIEVFSSAQLYGLRQSLPAVSSGSVEMAGVLGLNFAAVDRHFFASLLGYFWPDYERMYGFFEETPEGRAKIKDIEKKLGIRIICRVPTGPVAFFSSKPMNGTVADLKGRKSRYQTSAEKPGLAALGINGVSVSFGEVYTALTQGRIDTVQTNPSTIKATSWWEPMKYAQLPYSVYIDGYLVANAKWWDSLPADIQKTILEKVSPKIGKEAVQNIMKSSNDILKEFEQKHGGHVVTLSKSEQDKIVEIYRKSVWPVLSKQMNPRFFQAAKKYAGID